jgi:GTP-binding protein
VKNYKTVRAELKAYGGGLSRKPEIIALNKCDALTASDLKRKIAALKKVVHKDIYAISAVSRKGVPNVLNIMAKKIGQTSK